VIGAAAVRPGLAEVAGARLSGVRISG